MSRLTQYRRRLLDAIRTSAWPSVFLPPSQVRAGRTGPAAAPGRTRRPRLYVFGSSSAEVFDYIFGPSPRYRSHWASGWSARGFRNGFNRRYLLSCLDGADADDIIFLHFFPTDVQFNAAYKMTRDGIPDSFCQEAAEGILGMARDLRAAGFHRIHVVFAAPPVPLPDEYYQRLFRIPAIAPELQVRMLRTILGQVAGHEQVLDLSPVLADEHGVAKPEFRRPYPDHHADYIRIQELVWEAIRDIPGIPPRRKVWLKTLYAHRPRSIRRLVWGKDVRPVNIARRQQSGPPPGLIAG